MAVHGTEHVVVSFHQTYYCIYGEDTGHVIRVTPQTLHDLADSIKENIPETVPLAGAQFIKAVGKFSGTTRIFAKIDGQWYNHDGVEYSEEQLLEDYNVKEVIR